MACIIAAPSSSSGKTLLSVILSAWAKNNQLNLQPFKIGPDYLDSQLLTSVSQRFCRNLDLILCKEKWINETFYKYGGLADLTLIEGVMGLFDGIGSTSKGSTADIAKQLQLPIVLTINARGQAASLGPLVKGFRDQDPSLEIAGVVLNHVNTERHKLLLKEVLNSIDVNFLGSLPTRNELKLPSRHLGLIPAQEIENLEERIGSWQQIANDNLDISMFRKLLKAPQRIETSIDLTKITNHENVSFLKEYPVAIAEDKAFHFRYPETKECLEALGMPTISWQAIENEPIPKEAKGLIIPGGFPEQFAEQLSQCSKSINSIKDFYGKFPIYAECGGMLILGKSLTDLDGKAHSMTGLLPFNARKGQLKVGYRKLEGLTNSLILREKDILYGHEFHYWETYPLKERVPKLAMAISGNNANNFTHPWEIKGWNLPPRKEGWCNNLLHASWIHLHWPTATNVPKAWLSAVINTSNN